MNKIQGIYAASLTIFNKDLSLNINKTLKHADYLIDNSKSLTETKEQVKNILLSITTKT